MIKNRILLSAIIFSVAWHLTWLSVLTVTVTPKDTKPLKFSSVAFLGPILDQSVSVISPATRERSIPEKKYLSVISDLSWVVKDVPEEMGYMYKMQESGSDLFESNEMLTNLALGEVSGGKLEPTGF